ncbi:MAG TPA: SDR family NAD(P)-dependent oxidoreductase [Acidimicrobiales bacterium]|jgi:NAD(P)-dependent dehydrogenase (short-subunit alcohol dehydrogenase family)|nr:SDR family NAD(P)-dependent oxidoreductase [Acidimicrobiales bacterium]
MDLDLIGKRALVTGGSRGIGKAVALTLAQEGCDVVISARGNEALDTAAAEIREATGRRVVAVPADTGSSDSVHNLVATSVTELGGIDILVNSAAKPAGQAPPVKLAGITEELFWDEMNVKVMGYLRCAQAVAPLMMENGWGRIINVSGLAARRAMAAVGSIRNVAVAALTKNLADELGPHGVNVTVVHPGLTRTEATPGVVSRFAEARGIGQAQAEVALAGNSIQRLIDAREVADVVAFLASPRSVAINGDAIACGGGQPGAIYY